jgi:uncharacterized protein YndB with AHSA1/START domain
MLVKILIGLAVIVVVFIIVAATRPADFRVTRTTTISAPAAVVFAQVNDLHKWEAWNPWGKLDPACKMTYQGPPAGTGAGYTWAGNNKVGEGHMTITESRPNEFIRLNLEFLKPFKANNTAEFTFKTEGNQTAVAWSMSGKKNFMFKAVGLFMDTDKMVGGDFERGLADLKSVAEATSAPRT